MVVSEESGQLQMNLQIFCCLFLLLRLFSFPKTRALHRKGACFGTPTSAVPPNNSLRSNFQQNNKNPLLSPIPSASIKPYRYALQSQFAAITRTQNPLAASHSFIYCFRFQKKELLSPKFRIAGVIVVYEGFPSAVVEGALENCGHRIITN
ncbi:uncharacterized protein LOC107492377 isoform X1 [Arachis duranensis]|uniref:Uncharacterized protein LOC107492377 isoform X1 n=1 Tax=Arachis duranensis TaxID=130453 RepID=A0A6P4DIK8_ARADU|nr:uncharacterized protein LOC107492377 isoform X1 [Arachis duranensis]